MLEDMKTWLKAEDNFLFSNSLLSELYRPRNRLFTQWTDFKRVPVRNEYEQHICVVRGTEEYKLVSPIYRQNIYVGAFEELGPDETPINFFKPDIKYFPFSKDVPFLSVTLHAGDCLYIPAYYYSQSRTVGEQKVYSADFTRAKPVESESIIITQQFAAHSALVDIVLKALEEEILTDDKAHQWDATMMNYLKNLY